MHRVRDALVLLSAVATLVVLTAVSQAAELVDAAKSGNSARVAQLLAAGVSTETRDVAGWAALHHAASTDNRTIVQLLVASKANVNIPTDSGMTPLHLASDGGHVEVAKMLLASGAEINALARFDETPLDAAVKGRHPEMVALLRQGGGKSGKEILAQTDRIGEVLKQLGASNSTVREHAIYWLRDAIVLVGTRDPRTIAPLIAALNDTDDIVGEMAAHILGELKERRAIMPLIATLRKTGAREGAGVAALIKIGEPAVVPLIGALRDKEPLARRGAANALGHLRDSRAVEPLMAALRDGEASVRCEAALALVEIGRPAMHALIAALRDADHEGKTRMAMVLSGFSERQAKDTLASLTAEQERRRLARGYAASIQRGEKGTELLLALALLTHGDRSMATDFLNSPMQWGTLVQIQLDSEWEKK